MNQKIPRAEFEDSLLRLKRSAFRWRLGSALLALALAALAGWNAWQWAQENLADDLGWAEVDPSAPAAAEIKKIIAPLRYSALIPILAPDIRIAIDPAKRTWTIRNIRTYDAAGNVTLDQDRYGICGELAAYTLPRIRKILGKGYAAEVIRTSESGYFPAGTSQHFIILITDLSQPDHVYILDPSFHRYGPAYRFKNYAFFAPDRSFLADRNPDMVNPVATGVPLVIRRGYLLLLGVVPVNGKFDAGDNALKLTLFKKNEYVGQDVLRYVRVGGRVVERDEDEARLKSYLGADDEAKLRARLTELFEEIPQNAAPAVSPRAPSRPARSSARGSARRTR
ncbi:MAG: hypothetical protein KGM24_09215 [Elusimicrobia bacterium]|nr:hypothetical protein [Elusimicrobiota bacterium]